jgi:hypothetical protein
VKLRSAYPAGTAHDRSEVMLQWRRSRSPGIKLAREIAATGPLKELLG